MDAAEAAWQQYEALWPGAIAAAEGIARVWQARGDMMTRTVDMAVANLRRKIETDPSAPRIVITVKGAGYMWGER